MEIFLGLYLVQTLFRVIIAFFMSSYPETALGELFELEILYLEHRRFRGLTF